VDHDVSGNRSQIVTGYLYSEYWIVTLKSSFLRG